MHWLNAGLRKGCSHSIGLASALLCAFAGSHSFATTYQFNAQTKPSVTAEVKTTLFSFQAKSSALQGEIIVNLEKGEMEGAAFSIEVITFDTGIELRNQHMREKVFEQAQFSKATFTLKSLILPSFKDKCPSGCTLDSHFLGTLNLHGVQKEIAGKGKLIIASDLKTLSLEGDFELLLSDFNMKAPSFNMISVKDKIKIHVEGRGISVYVQAPSS